MRGKSKQTDSELKKLEVLVTVLRSQEGVHKERHVRAERKEA